MMLAGAGIEAKVVKDWIEAGSGALMAVRAVTVGMTLAVAGGLTLFGSFFISLLTIERR
jgi:hypothetical protein